MLRTMATYLSSPYYNEVHALASSDAYVEMY